MPITQLRRLSAALVPVVIVASVLPALAHSQENPVDCEILICMAAGFPAASDCTPALNEMIDRVTPWPIEPPLQIWNCPMNIPQEYGRYEIDLASPEYAFATSFRVFNVNIDADRDETGSCSRSSTIEIGTYDDTGAFQWRGGSRASVPSQVGVEMTGCSQRLRTVFIEWEDETGVYSSEQINY